MGATKVGAIAIGLAGALAASPAYSQSAGGGSDAEIALLKQQLKMLEQKLDKLQKQTNANTATAASANANAKAADAKAARVASANAAIPVKGPVAPSGVVVTLPNNRPTICTADEQNCVAITSRVHWDVGGYDYRPNTASTSPQKLDSGENLRRARIGIVGKFFGDWNYSLIYDFGGTADGFGGTGAAGATAVGFLPGGGTSGIENAFLSYTGLKPFGGKMAIEAGIMDIAWTLDESTSSNDIMFMERAAPANVATGVNANLRTIGSAIGSAATGAIVFGAAPHGTGSGFAAAWGLVAVATLLAGAIVWVVRTRPSVITATTALPELVDA